MAEKIPSSSKSIARNETIEIRLRNMKIIKEKYHTVATTNLFRPHLIGPMPKSRCSTLPKTILNRGAPKSVIRNIE